MNNPAFVLELDSGLKTKVNDENTQSRPYTYEEAIALTQVGKFHYRLLAIAGLCFLSVMVDMIAVSIIMPATKCDLPSTITEQSLLTSASFAGIVLSSHIMGFLADISGRIKILRIALLLSGIASIVSAFSVHIWMLIFFRFLNGLFVSGGQACVFSLCGEFHSNKSRVRHVTLLAGFLPASLMYSPALAVAILPLHIDFTIFGMVFGPWRLLLLTNALLAFITCLGLHLLPETPKFLLVQGRQKEALEILRSIFVANTGKPASEYVVTEIVEESGGTSISNIHSISDGFKMVWNQTVPLFQRGRCLHTINICVVQFLLYGIAQGIFMWFPTSLNEMFDKKDLDMRVCRVLDNYDATVENSSLCNGTVDVFTYYVLIIMGALFIAMYLVFAYLIEHISKKALLVIYTVIGLASAVALHYTSNLVLVIAMFVIIMNIGSCGGIVGTIAIEFFPTYVNAMGMCFIMMIGRLGAVFSSNIVGPLLYGNCDLLFWSIAGTCILIAVQCYFLPERKHEKVKKIKNKKISQ